MTFKTDQGSPQPLGSKVTGSGVNFALFSRHAQSVTLLLFQAAEEEPCVEIKLDGRKNRTGDIWHILLMGLEQNMRYGYRVDGPNDPAAGHMFDSDKILLDPYCQAVSGSEVWDKQGKTSKIAKQWRSLIVDSEFDWQGDRPLNIPMKDTIIYEAHVRGFTRHKSSGVKHPGTYSAVVEKIPYLKELGITALELMPVTEFNENENIFRDPESGNRLKNFWGYSPLAFFAPKASYAVNGFDGKQVVEFKNMVKELHKAGIEVILDIVFNHTAEGGEDGPTISFRGLDNTIYYILDRQSREYKNYSGCGNTFNCNHPLVRSFIMDCLHYWVIEMHVDGFRFDLASILGRDQNGEVLSNPPIVERIAEDPILADTKIIAEAWDAAGLYQVGNFSSHVRWAEWNGKFRDNVRSFMCGAKNSVAPLATRIAGSSDLYEHGGRRPLNSINFVTSHDGFTLYDLVSYNHKHNEKNGEDSRDGENHNISWNSGVEGATKSKNINDLRERRLRTMSVILFLSQGTPMMTAGDEACRTQGGNNNAYCQDNEISWFDWRLTKKRAGMVRFFKQLIKLRKNHPVFRREDFFRGAGGADREVVWQALKRGKEDWTEECKVLAFYLNGEIDSSIRDDDFFVMLNSDLKDKIFEVPKAAAGQQWTKLIDTAAPHPRDIIEESSAQPLLSDKVMVAGMASVVLISKRTA